MDFAKRFKLLMSRGLISTDDLQNIIASALSRNVPVETVLLEKGIPKHLILFSLSECYGRPYVEFEESVVVSIKLLPMIDIVTMKKSLWVPLSAGNGRVEIVAYDPFDPAMLAEVNALFPGFSIDFSVALPEDIVRIIEHNKDLNPNFPDTGGRTPLAKVRTFLADRRSVMSWVRTSLSKGRTGLAMLRTGISFITISSLLLRLFGYGWVNMFEAALSILGIVLVYEGIKWYLPARFAGKQPIWIRDTRPKGEMTVLEVVSTVDPPSFVRSAPIAGSGLLRRLWDRLSPVMRRRFLASDRTDFAEERTVLAYYRSIMAKARTGLAFTRSGIAFTGLGIGFIRGFPHTGWTALDVALIVCGLLMIAEGFYWYLPGRSAGSASLKSLNRAAGAPSFWDAVVPPYHRKLDDEMIKHDRPKVHAGQSPGIWATTGLALERTLLAERRNVMARLRTLMARSRTGLALIRTGISITSVGLGLQVYFGFGNTYWTILNSALLITGLLFVADGIYWHVPAQRIRRQFPYCFGDIEIMIPDYGVPSREWKKVIFGNG